MNAYVHVQTIMTSIRPASDDIGAISYVISDDLSQTDDSKLYFSPDRGNVVFASAADAWGFRPSDFLTLWSEKLNVSVDELDKFLWGDYYISRSPNEGCGGRTVFKSDAHSNGRKPVFVQLVLEPLWKAYQTLIVDKHLDEVFPMAEKLNIHLDPRAVRGANCRSVLRAFLMAWLPLGQHLLETITDVCPSPLEAMSVERAVRMLYGDNVSCPQGELQPHRSVNAVKFSDAMVAADVPHSFPDHITPNSDACLAIQATSSSPDAPTIVFVAKLFWTDKIQLSTSSFLTPDAPMNTCDGPIHPIGPESTLTASGSSQSALPPLPTPINLLATMEFVALARIFSGSIYPGQRLFVLGPKFDGSKVPRYLMDSDPSDLPVGPIRINTTDGPQRFLSSEGDTNRLDQVSSTNCIKSPDLESSGSSYDSTDVLHSGVTYLKHAYVAVVERVIQFMGGQRDLIEVNHPVPVGNIVGLTGTDLINFLPKSGLLVSRLSLVASKEVRSHEGVILSAPSTTLSGLALWYGPPVVSVAIEPASAANPEDSQRLEQGLRLLDKSDPCAEVSGAVFATPCTTHIFELLFSVCLIEDLTTTFEVRSHDCIFAALFSFRRLFTTNLLIVDALYGTFIRFQPSSAAHHIRCHFSPSWQHFSCRHDESLSLNAVDSFSSIRLRLCYFHVNAKPILPNFRVVRGLSN
ncbi:unnamed protein product [Dicrocoelium dendriticum]|nr:unnamed protein product [Dicrocoelium dendriticum]